MERFLIAVDCEEGSRKIASYLARVLGGAPDCELVFFHVLATASPDKLRMDEVLRIEEIHAQRPDLEGYFWKEEDEKSMYRAFAQARDILAAAGFADERISADFCVESDDLAQILLEKTRTLECSTIVLGRRRIGRLKEFLLGSVSFAVLKMARGIAVWVVED